MLNELIILAISNIENEEDQIFMTDLYSNYRELMKATAFGYVRNIHDAEDIVQKAYFKLLKHVSILKTFECCTLVSYIVSTIETVSIDWLRGQKKHSNLTFLYGEDEDEIVQEIPDNETPEKIFLQKYGAERLRQALDQLSPRYKLILQCKYFQDMSDKEIGKIVDIKTNSVREYLTRARNALRKILEKEYDFHGSE